MNLKTVMKPGTVAEWAEWSRSQLFHHVRTFKAALDLSEEAFMARRGRDLQLACEDEYAARVLSAVLDRSSINVRNMTASMTRRTKEEMASGDRRPRFTDSGFRMWHAILESEKITEGARQLAAVETFGAKIYLTMGMSYETYVEATSQMLTDFGLLPEEERKGRDADVKMLFDKLPAPMSELARDMKEKLLTRRAQGGA